MGMKKGKCVRPKYSEEEMATVDGVLTQLNQRNCFDFELDAGIMYRLRIRSDGEAGSRGTPSTGWLFFVRSDGVWKHDTSNSFTRWRSQLVRNTHGTISDPKHLFTASQINDGVVQITSL